MLNYILIGIFVFLAIWIVVMGVGLGVAQIIFDYKVLK